MCVYLPVLSKLLGLPLTLVTFSHHRLGLAAERDSKYHNVNKHR